MAFWLPVFLNLVAKDHACGYTFEPMASYDKDVTDRFFRGYENRSTVCTYNWTKGGEIDYNVTGTYPPLWMERINPYYGINVMPVYIREQEPARDKEEQKVVSIVSIGIVLSVWFLC